MSGQTKAQRTAGMTQLGRLAMREEGNNWCAYYAMPDTMAGAELLGSVRMAIIDRDPARKTAFINLMREAVSDIVEDATGHRPTWGGLEAAPERERAGRA